MTRIAQALRLRIFEIGCSMREAARRSNVSHQYFGPLIQGKLVPSLKVVNKISKALGMDSKHMAVLAAADYVELNYGVSLRAGGEDVLEFAALRTLWTNLSESEKKVILAILHNVVEQNQKSSFHGC